MHRVKLVKDLLKNKAKWYSREKIKSERDEWREEENGGGGEEEKIKWTWANSMAFLEALATIKEEDEKRLEKLAAF